jgi:hypothetical protein
VSGTGPVETIALDAHVVIVLGEAPKLTAQQLDRLASLLRTTPTETQAAA